MNKMFIAKFAQIKAENNTKGKFKADKHQELPFIGEVLAGVAVGSIMNGTMFQREGLETGKLYLCENTIDPEYPEYPQVKVIAPVSVLEFATLRATLGQGRLIGQDIEEEDNTPLIPKTNAVPTVKEKELV